MTQLDDLLALAGRTAGRNLSTNEWQSAMPGHRYSRVFPALPIPPR